MVLQLDKAEIDEFVEKVNFEKFGGLVPVVVQDVSNDEVLMQAFVNEEALRLTLATGRMHFWSRSRERMWLKGESSGHYSLVQNIVLDCDNDAILSKVQQVGVICHTGRETCFHKPIIEGEKSRVDGRIVERIFEVVLDRIGNPEKGSYVSRLVAEGEDAILQKVGEEVVEFILASKDNGSEGVIHEATDVLFHILVLLAKKGYMLREVFGELEHRHRVKTQR